MSDDEALARATFGPDLLPRLVYADWLDERADPRAEFLRLTCGIVSAVQRLAELAPALPPGWAETVDPLPFRLTVIRLPLLGDGVDHACIRRWPTPVWTVVRAGDPLCDVETDMAYFALPAEFDCVPIVRLAFDGKIIAVGSPLCVAMRL